MLEADVLSHRALARQKHLTCRAWIATGWLTIAEMEAVSGIKCLHSVLSISSSQMFVEISPPNQNEKMNPDKLERFLFQSEGRVYF